MPCNHERLKCRDNVFLCAVCGAVVQSPFEADKQEGREEKPVETQKKAEKKAVRRKRKESE